VGFDTRLQKLFQKVFGNKKAQGQYKRTDLVLCRLFLLYDVKNHIPGCFEPQEEVRFF
jgi:hypothetical protein